MVLAVALAVVAALLYQLVRDLVDPARQTKVMAAGQPEMYRSASKVAAVVALVALGRRPQQAVMAVVMVGLVFFHQLQAQA